MSPRSASLWADRERTRRPMDPAIPHSWCAVPACETPGNLQELRPHSGPDRFPPPQHHYYIRCFHFCRSCLFVFCSRGVFCALRHGLMDASRCGCDFASISTEGHLYYKERGLIYPATEQNELVWHIKQRCPLGATSAKAVHKHVRLSTRGNPVEGVRGVFAEEGR